MQVTPITKKSLERIYPADNDVEKIAGYNTFMLHEERYHYAGKNISPGEIADIACGSGYGSYLLATSYNLAGGKIIAIDGDAEAIDFAKKKFTHDGIEFIHQDIFSFKPSVLFDTIVSLETIEHLTDPVKFVNLFSSYLKKGGRFVASVPITPSMDANPYHLHDFTIASFKILFVNAGLKEIGTHIQDQKFNPFKLFNKKESRTATIRKNLAGFYFKNPGKFFLRISSLLKYGFKNKYLLVVFEKI